MKATIEIDATPQEMLQKTRDKTLAGIEASEPAELMRLLMPTADQFKSLESLQASFWQALGKGMDLSGKEKK